MAFRECIGLGVFIGVMVSFWTQIIFDYFSRRNETKPLSDKSVKA